MNHKDLVKIAEKWLSSRCGFVFSELAAQYSEIPDAIGFRSYGSVLIECKATRGDFLKDKKKPFRRDPKKGVGMYRFYMCPKGLIDIKELPEKWGLLNVSPSGRVYHAAGPKTNIWDYSGDEWKFERNKEAEFTLP